VIERSGVSRGHSIPKQSGEGLNVERSLNFAGLVSNAMKAANPDKGRDYQREVGVELRDNAGEPEYCFSVGRRRRREDNRHQHSAGEDS